MPACLVAAHLNQLLLLQVKFLNKIHPPEKKIVLYFARRFYMQAFLVTVAGRCVLSCSVKLI